jgi:multidrug efflux system membrane fusion protein
VPESAVVASQAGNAVFVVKADDTVEFRPVTIGRSVEGRTVIDKGVDSGERVVTDGQLRLTNGSKVQAKAPAAKGPA